MNGRSCFATLLLMAGKLFSSTAGATEPYVITLTQGNSVTLSAYGASPATTTGSAKLALSLPGTEASACAPIKDERKSSASSSADVNVVERRQDGITLELLSNTVANGGKYHDCVLCQKGPGVSVCIGSKPQYTTASAESKAGATVAIAFAPTADEATYFLDVGVANRGATAALSVADQAGEPVPLADRAGTYSIRARPGATFYVSATLDTRVSHRGEFGSDTAANASRVDIKLRRAPLLTANRGFMPYIKGGKETSSFKTVGALLIDGLLHCTATVVGPTTLLTAAHCIQGYENQLSNFTFLIGANIVQPTYGPVQVIGFAYPDGTDRRFSFDRKTLKDDIGLLYLKTAASAKAIELHNGVPSWDAVLSGGKNLIFVGFGFDVISGEQVGASIKREAAWQINAVESRRVLFSVPKTSTCKGDSGGPAFIIEDEKLVQVAVTSGGEEDCSAGFETRIDSFQPWLAGRIR